MLARRGGSDFAVGEARRRRSLYSRRRACSRLVDFQRWSGFWHSRHRLPCASVRVRWSL